jgi:hypothetical protein
MVQRKLGMYVANRIKDEIMAPPKPGAENQIDGEYRRDDRSERSERYERSEPADDLHGQIVRDDEGNAIGRAFRVPDVALYVIARDGRNPSGDLTRAIHQDSSRLVFQATPNGRITSIIYVADESPSAGGLQGARADEV